MSASYFVRYEGEGYTHKAFLSQYRDRHVPILARFPGIRRILLHVPTTWEDPFPVTPDRFTLLVEMVFDCKADLEAALQSEARAAARADFANLQQVGTVRHQATASEEVFSR